MSVGNVGISRPFSRRDNIAGENPVCSASCASPMLRRKRKVRSLSAIAKGRIASSTVSVLVGFGACTFFFSGLGPFFIYPNQLTLYRYFTAAQLVLLNCQFGIVAITFRRQRLAFHPFASARSDSRVGVVGGNRPSRAAERLEIGRNTVPNRVDNCRQVDVSLVMRALDQCVGDFSLSRR